VYCFKPIENIPDGDWFYYEYRKKDNGQRNCIVCGKAGNKLTTHQCSKSYHIDCLQSALAKIFSASILTLFLYCEIGDIDFYLSPFQTVGSRTIYLLLDVHADTTESRALFEQLIEYIRSSAVVTDSSASTLSVLLFQMTHKATPASRRAALVFIGGSRR